MINWETVKPENVTLKDLESRIPFTGSYTAGGWRVCAKLYLIYKIDPKKYMSLSIKELNSYTEQFFINVDMTMHMFEWANAILKTKLYEAGFINEKGEVLK